MFANYLVSYYWLAGPMHGFNNLVAYLESPVRSAEHLRDLEARIRRSGPFADDTSIVILNIIKLE